jgi:large subunit ribosomal protein L4e
MFGPTKTYRRWHRRVNKAQRRYALVSALAATSSTALVFARGHRIDRIPEIPLVVADNTIVNVKKTKEAVTILKALKAYADVQKVIDTKKIRAGRGKMRNRRYVKRRGPLIIFEKNAPLIKAFRNIPGIDFLNVHRLNLLKLAPGGHLGRFVIWTETAFKQLDSLYGTYKSPSKLKIGFSLPRVALTNSDLTRLINSQEIQSHLRPKKRHQKRPPLKRNPLKNLGYLIKLNPYAKLQRERELKVSQKAVARRKLLQDRRKAAKQAKAEGKEVTKKDRKKSTKPKNKDAETYRKLFVKTLLS